MAQSIPFDKKCLFCKKGKIVEIMLKDPQDKSNEEFAAEGVVYIPLPSNPKTKLEFPVTIWMCTICKFLHIFSAPWDERKGKISNE